MFKDMGQSREDKPLVDNGLVAQLEARLLCTQGVTGSSPVRSTVGTACPMLKQMIMLQDAWHPWNFPSHLGTSTVDFMDM